MTSTPGFGGTLSQTIPAVASTDLIPAGSQRSILHIREGDGFRSNLVLASDADVSTAVDVALVRRGRFRHEKLHRARRERRGARVVRDMGVSGAISGARLVVSSATTGAAFGHWSPSSTRRPATQRPWRRGDEHARLASSRRHTSLSTVAHAGQGVWTSNGPYGGDITAIAVDPSNPATLYAGTGDGRGVFKSTDSGSTWVTTDLPNPYIRALAISPSSPSILYAAGNNGVFESTDSAASWAGPSAGLASTYVTTLAVDPTTPTTLYVGTYAGVFKSTDGGGNWTAINGHFVTGLNSSLVVALAVDPSTPTTLYVSTAGEGGGVSKSTDGEKLDRHQHRLDQRHRRRPCHRSLDSRDALRRHG